MIIITVGTAVWAATDKSGAWHSSSQVEVTVGGTEKSLQDAINSDLCRLDSTNCAAGGAGSSILRQEVIYPTQGYTQGIELIDDFNDIFGPAWNIQDSVADDFIEFNVLVPEGTSSISSIKLHLYPFTDTENTVVFNVETAKVGPIPISIDSYSYDYLVLGREYGTITINSNAYDNTNPNLNAGDIVYMRVSRESDMFPGQVYLYAIEVNFA